MDAERLGEIRKRVEEFTYKDCYRAGYAIRGTREMDGAAWRNELIASVKGPSPDYIRAGDLFASSHKDLSDSLRYIDELHRLLSDKALDSEVASEAVRIAMERCAKIAEKLAREDEDDPWELLDETTKGYPVGAHAASRLRRCASEIRGMKP